MKRLYQLPLDTLFYIKLVSFGLLILRLVFGLMLMIGHGWTKIENWSTYAPNFKVISFLPPEANLGLAIFGEFVCAGLVALGLMTRLACIPVIITMVVAITTAHWNDPVFMSATAPKAKEMALLYLTPFLVLFFTGPGIYSMEGLWAKRDSAVLDDSKTIESTTL